MQGHIVHMFMFDYVNDSGGIYHSWDNSNGMQQSVVEKSF
jgi:hypothetical protein